MPIILIVKQIIKCFVSVRSILQWKKNRRKSILFYARVYIRLFYSSQTVACTTSLCNWFYDFNFPSHIPQPNTVAANKI